MTHWLSKVMLVLQANTADLRELAKIAGGDLKTFYRGVRPEDLDLVGQNLEGIEFSEPSPPAAANPQQLNFSFPENQRGELTPSQIASKIKRAVRQEERAALLLSVFLVERELGMQIIEFYGNDKAKLTNSVLGVLKEIAEIELLENKRFTNLYIARKVSGRFARTVEKRAILAYFMAKYLHHYPDINVWLRRKSVSWLSSEAQREFETYLLKTKWPNTAEPSTPPPRA